MDGFTGNEGVIVLAATNRPEILDAALLRPGRFDRRVTVSVPDQRGRRQILAVHTRNVPLAPGVDLGAVAAATPGMVGADVMNLVNEAALRAARRREDRVTMADFSGSLEKIVLGTARGIVLFPGERERTAFRESGHALFGMLTPAVETLRGSPDRLDRLAHTLLNRETLDEDEAYAAAGISRDTAPATGARAATR